LKPNGRDDEVGTGRSPQSPAAHRADTHKYLRSKKLILKW